MLWGPGTKFRRIPSHFNHCLTAASISSDLRAFHRLRQHYDDSNFLLPDHSPEVGDGVAQTALGRDVPHTADVIQLKTPETYVVH